jgi:oligoribonuclease NrnB/cAMP/cGMP phosphodiesterase (DHH superfamily)
MKILLFTHISDVDGLNNVVLSKQAFKKVEYVLCEASDVDNKIREKIIDFDLYDYIYVTDLCPTDNMLLFIDASRYKNKFKVFDHHKGALEQLSRNYDFVTLKIEDDKGLCCGTSLFYEYLVSNNLIKSTDNLNKLVELTRKYDTWEWKKDNNIDARNLTWLFNACGIDEYLKILEKRVMKNDFSLEESDYEKIEKWKNDFDLQISTIVKRMKFMSINGYKAGIVSSAYEYRNDIADYIRDRKYDIDFLAIVFTDKSSVSYRSIKEDVDVNEIAKLYGGKGHVNASSSPITEKEKKDINKYFNKDREV